MKINRLSVIIIFLSTIALVSCVNKNMNDGLIKDKHFSKAEQNQSQTDSLLTEARELLAAKNYGEAIDKFEESDIKFGTNNLALNEKALCYIQLKNYSKALEVNTIAINLNPDNPSAWSNRGLTYGHTGKFEMALLDFDKSIKLDSLDSRLYYNRCYAHINLDDKTSACEDLQKAIDLGFTEKHGAGAEYKYNTICK